jgi:hypothetical protein
MSKIKQFDSLNTSYVNVAALIRYLREQEFKGSVHVALGRYEADVILNGQSPAAVFEIDRLTGHAAQDEGAMERLLVHAREPGGTITVFNNAKESRLSSGNITVSPAGKLQADIEAKSNMAPPENVNWDDLLQASGDLIAALERAMQSTGSDFAENFRAARIGLGDDYPFLDPTIGDLKYSSGSVTLRKAPSADGFVAGLTECLRRMVNKLAMDKEEKRFRERVAVELAIAARIRANAVGAFTSQLDRIAGTRVL